jgi:hypothetical protein
MYFDGYEKFSNASLNPKLLWDYNLSDFDFNGMRDIVVQRVIERGWPNDWYFILNFYGIQEVKSAIKEISYLNAKDMSFVSHQFNIPLKNMKCFEKNQSTQLHWSS